MEHLLKKTKLVKQILQEVPVTRRDDGYLLLEYYRRKHIDTSESFKHLVLTGQVKDIMSVIRTRQKVQEQFPDLRDERTYRARRDKEPEYVEFAMEVNRKTINEFDDKE